MDATEVSGGNTGGSTPTSFAEAFAPVDSPSAEPVAQDTTPSAAAQPSPSAETPQQEERSAFIPRSRFDEVNTERNTFKQQLDEWKTLEWAKNPIMAEAAQRIARHQGNPLGLLSELLQDLGPHPEYGPQLRSLLGQQFGALRQRQQEPTLPEADVAVTDAQGNVVSRVYSDAQLAKRDEFLRQQWLKEVDQKLAPRFQTLDQIKAEREKAVADQAATQFSTGIVEYAKQEYPHFDIKVHGPAVAAEIHKLQLPSDAHPAVVEAAALRALNKVMLPTLGAKAQSQLLDSLQQKATASTAINPASATPASRSGASSFHDASLQWK